MKRDFKKIAVFRALHLGDLLCTTPAFRALRQHYPDAHISLIGLPWASAFQSRFAKYIDELILFPGYPGLPEQIPDEEQFPVFMENMRRRQFDLLLQMQGNGTIVNELLSGMKAGFTAGFRPDGDYADDNNLFIHYPETLHEIDRHLALLQQLGITTPNRMIEFPVTDKDQDEYNKLHIPYGEKRFIVVHPGSKGSWRRWPAPYFAALADYVADTGFKVIITGVAGEEDIVQEVISYMRYPAVNLCGKTSLGSMAVLLQKSRLLISNCTGVAHIASALQTPSIVISMDGEPHRWGALDDILHYTHDWTTSKNYDRILHKTDSLLLRTMPVLAGNR